MGDGVERIRKKIRSFQRRYYLNIFIRGAILTLSILVVYFLTAALLESALWLSNWMRFFIFFTFFGIAAFCVYRFLKDPLQWWLARRGMNEEESAQIIGSSIPTVKDRLVNLIQLSTTKDSALAYASIQQKSLEFEPLSFDTIVDLRKNTRYLKYLIIPIAVILGILIINRSLLTQSAERIVHFNRHYSPQAPFTFVLADPSLIAFQNEDFTIDLSLQGTAIPEDVYVITPTQRIKLDASGNGDFSYTFEKIQEGFSFQFEAAGFFSEPYKVTLANRPELTKFNVDLVYPKYLQRKGERINNAGHLEVPEGTVVTWQLNTSNARKAIILFSSDSSHFEFQSPDNDLFKYSKGFKTPDTYEIELENEKSKNRDKISYRIDVIKDDYPKIAVSNFNDSILYKRVVLGGNVSDDYGITELVLHFRIRDEKQKELSADAIRIPVARNQAQQSFFYNWSLDSFKLKPGHTMDYYLQVWDNDGVNGRKSTKSGSYTFFIPTADNLVTEIRKSQSQTEKKIDQSVSKADKLTDQIEQAQQKLKGKQNLDWQDKKMLEDIVQQKQNLENAINELKEQNKLLEQKKNAFTEQDERIKEKAEQIQKLMEELLDEETRKLFEELKKLLEENQDVSQIEKVLDKMNKNSNNLEKELQRTLELYKQLQYDFKLDQTIKDLKEQTEKQQALLDKTESLEKENAEKDGSKNKDGKQKEQKDQGKENSKENDQGKEEGDNKDSQELAKEQEKLKEEFKDSKEKVEELKKLGKELDKDENLPSEENMDDVEKQQEQSEEMMKQNSPSKSKPMQQKAVQKMQQMQQQMQDMQNSMEMDMDAQNLEALRQIIHGLVKLSFDQEGLMKEFNDLQQSDPRFNPIAQRQLKLKDDAKVLEDSLLALGKRDPFMGSFITKEITELNDHLFKVIDANKERKRPQAAGEMQMTMTSINNLALMLDDHFDMMMQMMANAKPGSKGKKKGGQKPSLSELQQQLNNKIQELKGSGKSGKQLSEELAEMAAEQERIRRALQQMEEKMKKEGKNPGGDLPSKMEQTEMDLVNKQLTDQLIQRQKNILTRLLESEKSMREQDQDEERKGETAKDYEKEIPKAFEEYLRLKEKEVELLKTVPPKLYPYYKKEVNDYFKRMGN